MDGMEKKSKRKAGISPWGNLKFKKVESKRKSKEDLSGKEKVL